jgi:hypothetical protein
VESIRRVHAVLHATRGPPGSHSVDSFGAPGGVEAERVTPNRYVPFVVTPQVPPALLALISARAPLVDRDDRDRRLPSSVPGGVSQAWAPSRLCSVTETSQELP